MRKVILLLLMIFFSTSPALAADYTKTSKEVQDARAWFENVLADNESLVSSIDRANFGSYADRDTSRRLSARYNDLVQKDALYATNVTMLSDFYIQQAECSVQGTCDAGCSYKDDFSQFYLLHANFLVGQWDERSENLFESTLRPYFNETCAVD